ncbi:hypothetical protein Noda2021_04860 [Candidatus Dependentiae bacterium Noda2021]|nr:hypothetical protein Noda2021_04860 [Candidatus Dependentiae bacterium Noda2021]
MSKYLLLSLLTLSSLTAMDNRNDSSKKNNNNTPINVNGVLIVREKMSFDEESSDEENSSLARFWIGESLSELQRKCNNK